LIKHYKSKLRHEKNEKRATFEINEATSEEEMESVPENAFLAALARNSKKRVQDKKDQLAKMSIDSPSGRSIITDKKADSIFNENTPVRSKASPRSKASASMNKNKSKSPTKGNMLARITDAFSAKISDPN
jgi:hypothetical protein